MSHEIDPKCPYCRIPSQVYTDHCVCSRCGVTFYPRGIEEQAKLERQKFQESDLKIVRKIA